MVHASASLEGIKKVAVIGSGVMGAGIAAHMANAGIPVLLLDIVPEGATNRNALAEAAIERLLKTDPAPLTHKRRAHLITPGNIEDDLSKLSDVDWIVEAVLEKLEVKQALYKKIDSVRKQGAVVSSNTSTLPLHMLVEGMSEDFRKSFMITHFFNPPRYMRLLELVTSNETDTAAIARIRAVTEVRLGKGVVPCKDTPGFIANRIGCFWLQCALSEAIKIGISVEEADAVMGKPVGVPKTAVFGLFDLIGIDLMPLIATSMLKALPEKDAFRAIAETPKLVSKMIADGYTGRKGKGGFYRLVKEEKAKRTEVIDLKTGDYRPEKKAALESAEASKNGLRALVTHPDIGGRYAWAVLSQTLCYVASLVPEISDDIQAIDEAMRLGYNWKYGPFELIDRLKGDDMSGAAWFASRLKEEGRPVPALLEQVGNQSFYRVENKQPEYFSTAGKFVACPFEKEAWTLADIKIRNTPVLKTGSAALWDVGDGIACFEITTKMNSIDPTVLEMMMKSIDEVKKGFKGLMIATDADNFCVGANLGFLLFSANIAAWKTIEDAIKQGQDTYMALKYAPFPVVSALNGMALGGGCELLLHSDAVQAHIESYVGLVEVGVGVIPGWGGCKEMLLRQLSARQESASLTAKLGRMFSVIPFVKAVNSLPAIIDSFETIGLAKVSKSAEEAKDMRVLNSKSRISMNRKRLLADAKQLTLSLVDGYTPPEPRMFALPGKTARAALEMAVNNLVKTGKATPHDAVIARKLAYVLSGGDTDMTTPLTEQQVLEVERAVFMELIRMNDSLARMEHMLDTGKPLRN